MAEHKVKSQLRLDLERIISKMMSREPYANTVSEKDNCTSYKKYMSACDCKNILMYLKWLEDMSLWPLEIAFGAFTIAKLCLRLSQYDDDLTNRHLWPCDNCRVKVGSEIAAAMSTALLSFRGLCLDCVKHGGRKRTTGPACRIPHDRTSSEYP